MDNEDQKDDDSNDSRKLFLSEMKTFIEKECSEIGELLDYLSWTPDHILKSRPMAQCPHDPSHLVPETSLKQHASACYFRRMGVLDQDLKLQLQNDDFFYKNTDLVGKVQLDEGLLNRIIWNHCMENRQVHMGHRSMPVGTDDWSVKLTPQERLAVYDHCVKILKEQGKMANVEKDEVLTTDWERVVKKGLLDEEKPKSKVELLAMLRDQKRRRQTYRAKNVHITKKSYTEIIREVIINQMEIMMPSQDAEDTSRPEDTRCNQERQRDAGSQFHSPCSSNHGYSRCRSRSQSHSPKKRKKRKSRSCSHSPRRRKSRSRSPRESSSGSSRHRRDYKREVPKDEKRGVSSANLPHQDEEGEIGSSDCSYQIECRQHSRKKSSKHKKHKHKKYKSKISHSDSDD